MTQDEEKAYLVDAAGQAHRAESAALERQAVALVKQYGTLLMMAPPVKAFFKRLAVFLKWQTLEKAL
jgi:hypothetical protein